MAILSLRRRLMMFSGIRVYCIGYESFAFCVGRRIQGETPVLVSPEWWVRWSTPESWGLPEN